MHVSWKTRGESRCRRSRGPALLLVGLLLAGIASIGAPSTPAAQAAPGDPPAPLNLRDLGSSPTIAFPGQQGEVSLSLAVPPDLAPTELRGVTQYPAFVTGGNIDVLQEGRLISRTPINPAVNSPISLSLRGVRVERNAADIVLRTYLRTAGSCLFDPDSGLRIQNATVTYGGREAAPNSVAEFLPPVLRKLTIFVPDDVRPAEGGRMIFAVTADATVKAERSLREFVQTLTKTFADLPIGLAIFDRKRNLQLFNPALIDLTGVETGFLTARPTLYAFLDRLREARMVPEPKDYRSWRNKMTSLEAAASSGHHVETWILPGGQTYRVTGRPHPDGAVAFLFEDITSEMSLTRRFRAELSLGAEVLDAVDEAIAVFDGSGRVVTTNRRYAAQWGDDTGATLADHMARWRRAAPDGAGLEALRHALTEGRGRDLARGAASSPNGGLMAWTVRPLSGARTMVSFDPETQGRPVVETTDAAPVAGTAGASAHGRAAETAPASRTGGAAASA